MPEDSIRGQFKCEVCGRRFQWRQEYSGKRVRCKCGHVCVVPEPDHFGQAEVPGTTPVRRASPMRAHPNAGSTPRHEVDQPPVQEHRSVSPIKWVAIGLGAVAVIAIIFVLVRQDSQTPMPLNSGGQSQGVGGATFHNFDSDTDINLVQIQSHKQIQSGLIVIDTKGRAKLHSVQGPNRQWVFVWQMGGDDHALQGIPLASDFQGGRNWSGRLNESVLAGEHSTAVLLDTHRCFDEALARINWTTKQTFGLISSRADLYIATVDHPTDAASTKRARAFLDEAIKHPRTIHHAHGLTALMRAVGDPKPAWIQWLRERAAKQPVELIAESDPRQDNIIGPLLLARAKTARVEILATLMLLTEFEGARFFVENVIQNKDVDTDGNGVGDEGDRILFFAANGAIRYPFKSSYSTLINRLTILNNNHPSKDIMNKFIVFQRGAEFTAMLKKRPELDRNEAKHQWKVLRRWFNGRPEEEKRSFIPLMEQCLRDLNCPTHIRGSAISMMFQIAPKEIIQWQFELMDTYQNDYQAISKLRIPLFQSILTRRWRFGGDDPSIGIHELDEFKTLLDSLFEQSCFWQRQYHANTFRPRPETEWEPTAKAIKRILEAMGQKEFDNIDERMIAAALIGQDKTFYHAKFYPAFDQGDLSTIESYFRSGVSPLQPDLGRPPSYRLLIHAVNEKNSALIKLVLKYKGGATIKDLDPSQQIPVEQAIRNGDIEIVKMLIEAGASVNTLRSPLRQVVIDSNRDMVTFLLKHGADPNFNHGDIMRLAPARPDLVILEQLVEHGGDKDDAFNAAVYNNNVEAANYLLAQGANLNHPDQYKHTALEYSIMHDNVDMMKSLLKRGATQVAEIGGFDGTTGRFQRVLKTPKLGSDSEGIQNIMTIAASWGRPKVFLWTIEQGAKPANAQPLYTGTLLHDVMSRKNQPNRRLMIGLLVKHGADPHAKNKSGQSAIAYALAKKLPQDVIDVLQGNAKPEAIFMPIYASWTLQQHYALEEAMKNPQGTDALKSLLDQNLNPNEGLVNRKISPIVFVINHEPMTNLLLASGARADVEHRGRRLYDLVYPSKKEHKVMMKQKYDEHLNKYQK